MQKQTKKIEKEKNQRTCTHHDSRASSSRQNRRRTSVRGACTAPARQRQCRARPCACRRPASSGSLTQCSSTACLRRRPPLPAARLAPARPAQPPRTRQSCRRAAAACAATAVSHHDALRGKLPVCCPRFGPRSARLRCPCSPAAPTTGAQIASPQYWPRPAPPSQPGPPQSQSPRTLPAGTRASARLQTRRPGAGMRAPMPGMPCDRARGSWTQHRPRSASAHPSRRHRSSPASCACCRWPCTGAAAGCADSAASTAGGGHCRGVLYPSPSEGGWGVWGMGERMAVEVKVEVKVKVEIPWRLLE